MGDLRKVFQNVKSRGGWGEVQIETILEDLLQTSQYEKNFEAKPGSGQRVEFAVKMPGNGNGEPVWMPIDSKFPTEDYVRLVEASAAGDAARVDASSRAIEACVRECAKTIADKYIKAFGQLAESPNQKILMLPIEATSVLSSLAGIGEIARATFGESAASATAAARRGGSVPSTGATPPPPPQR